MPPCLLLAIMMVISLFPITSASAATPETLALQYDDFYTFDGAANVSVGEGVTAIEVDGTTIHAVNVTGGPVAVTVDGTQVAVTVSKAKLNFVLIDGQSNAAGNCGKLDKAPVCPEQGVGYLWKNSSMKDLTETFTDTQTASVGFHPAIAAEWYELTGEKTLFYNGSHSGQAIRKWISGGWHTSTAAAVTNILSAIDTDKYDVVRTGYYWLQGESDACPDYIADYCYYTTTDEYQRDYQMPNTRRAPIQAEYPRITNPL